MDNSKNDMPPDLSIRGHKKYSSFHRCLYKTGSCLQFTPEKYAKVVVVCAKLHNLYIEDGMEENYDPAVQNNNDLNFDLEPNAHRRREPLINTF